MPGPTNESLATDFRDVMREFRAIRADISTVREEHADFRGRVEMQVGLIRWVCVFVAGILVTLVTSAIWLSWHASALTQRVESLDRNLTKIIDRLNQTNSNPANKTTPP